MKPCAMARAVSFVFLALGVVVMVAADSVIDELEKNGLPVGLLPSSVQSYSIGAKGDFSVSLEAPCYAKIEDQPAYYSKHITGKLKYGSISNLSGIQTKQLFVWLPVTGIYVDIPATPYIYFEVGVLTKRLSIAIFETPPRCSSHGVDTGIHVPNLIIRKPSNIIFWEDKESFKLCHRDPTQAFSVSMLETFKVIPLIMNLSTDEAI